jgi:hypothetical protein
LSKLGPFKEWITSIERAKAKRNKIKSDYRRIRQQIRENEPFELDFEDTVKLGDILENLHFKLLSHIRRCCYHTNAGKYMPVGNNTQRTERFIHIFIYLIKIKNILSIVFWVVFALGLIAAITAVTSITATYINCSMQAQCSLTNIGPFH